jgi:hypothetical protein
LGKLLAPETPLLEIPVAPVVLIVIGVNAVFMQSVGVDDAALAVLLGVMVIMPVALTALQPPVRGIL